MARNDNFSQGAQAYTADYYDQYESTISNGEARIPICFCIDTSASMRNVTGNCKTREVPGSRRMVDGRWVVDVEPLFPWQKLTTRMDELRRVLGVMLSKMKQNSIIARSAVVNFITFDQFADCQMEFTDLIRVSLQSVDRLQVNKDQTNVGKGLRMALQRLDQLERMNSNAGNDSYRPVLIFMSDGDPTDGEYGDRLRTEVRQRSEDGKLNVIPVGIGSGINERFLRSMSKDSRVYRMDTDKEFEQVFDEITRKIHNTTMVISMDEGESNMANQAQENVPNTQYGVSCEDFLEDFLNS